MRNLLGRLNARPPEDVTRIAAFWQVPVTTTDPHALAGHLYRTLTDLRAVRAIWDRLDDDERAVVLLLAADDGSPRAVTELAEHLNRDAADVRQTAARLYRAGIVAREGDDDPLPIGATPRVFVPWELALLFRRVRDEIAAGDLSASPLSALLERLDDAELEGAARTWGISVVPGLRSRAELTRELLALTADPDRVAAVAAKRKRDAAAIWRLLRAAPTGEPVPLPDASAGAGLDGDDPRAGHRLREALAELESSLLVWHTYRPDGSRWLFVPAELRAARTRPAPTRPAFDPLPPDAVAVPPWRHPDALAWDLLTLLRDLTGPNAPPWSDASALPRGWLRHLNHRLWNRRDELPPTGYVDLLVALAFAEGLVQRPDQPDAPLLAIPAARAWRDRSFAHQSAQLWRSWLSGEDWIEGKARGEIELWGVAWPAARRRLAAHLGALDAGAWYAVDGIAESVAARDPALLGPTVTVATARHVAPDTDHRRAAVAEVVAIMLESALAWFGLVDVATTAERGRAARLTDVGIARAGGTRLPPAPTATGPAMEIPVTGEILLHQPTPLRVWSLLAFAEPERLDHTSLFRLTPESIGRALAAGFDLTQVTTFLTKQSGAALPAPVAVNLTEWAHGFRRVRLRHALLLTPDDTDALAELERLTAAAGLATEHLGDDTLVVEIPHATGSDPDPADALLAHLRAHGFTVQRISPSQGRSSAGRAQQAAPLRDDSVSS